MKWLSLALTYIIANNKANFPLASCGKKEISDRSITHHGFVYRIPVAGTGFRRPASRQHEVGTITGLLAFLHGDTDSIVEKKEKSRHSLSVHFSVRFVVPVLTLSKGGENDFFRTVLDYCLTQYVRRANASLFWYLEKVGSFAYYFSDLFHPIFLLF